VLALALVLDLAFSEPPTPLHPVVWIGRLAGWLEQRAPRDQALAELTYGATLTVAVVGSSAAAAVIAQRLIGGMPSILHPVLLAVALKPTFALRALLEAGEAVRQPLAHGDLPAARQQLRSLVSRDTSDLSTELVASAAVESLAENASDSLVAPWLFYAVGGLPAAYAYRAANTLDAMIGYRGRYEWLGKAAAHLDDALNWLPARLTALLIALASEQPVRALAIAARDHGLTDSPNAGWPMAAMAGALGVQLEKVGHYRLGDPRRRAQAEDIRRGAAILSLRRFVP
jgi:adenosylcobinamide-phosphate synthase